VTRVNTGDVASVDRPPVLDYIRPGLRPIPPIALIRIAQVAGAVPLVVGVTICILFLVTRSELTYAPGLLTLTLRFRQ
jgi:hypothetical protein